MEILDKDIAKFCVLYKLRFGIELQPEAAREKLSKMLRQIEAVYRPITKQQAKRLKERT